jgi:mannose-6-phosphate isomerase-like protein (cupin superfamily)
MNKVDLPALGAKLKTPWVPLEISDMGEYHGLLVLYEGSYPPHYHNKDEFFLVLEGMVDVEIEGGGTITLREKESLLIPAGVHHRSSARTPRALVFIFESKDISYNPVVMVGQVAEFEEN